MTPQHTGARPDDPATWGAADMETIQNTAGIDRISELPDADAQRRLARCSGLWAAATDYRRRQAARQKRAARRTLRVRRALHLAA